MLSLASASKDRPDVRVVDPPPLPPPGRIERVRGLILGWHLALKFERYHPAAAATVAGTAVFILGVSEATSARLAANVFPVALNAAAVFAGFQAASQSVMLAVFDSPTMKALRKSGHYRLLVDYQWGLIKALFLFIFAGLTVLALNAAGASDSSFCRTSAAVLAFLFTWLFLACLRAARLMVKLLRAGQGSGE